MSDQRNLRVLEAAGDFAEAVRAAAGRRWPGRGRGYDQLLTSAESVPANIAEGAGKGGDRQMANGLRIALGSANEVGVHLRRARSAGHIDAISWARCESKRVVVCKMITAFLRAVEARIARNTNP